MRALAEPIVGEEPGFESKVLDGLGRGDPLELAALSEGTALAVWKDGTARLYWPNGRSLDETLPVRFSPPGLPALPTTRSNLGFFLFSRPFYTPSSPYGRMLGALPELIPWEQSARGEQIIPALLEVEVRSLGWFPYLSRFNGRPPAAVTPPFEIKGCVGGGAVLLEDGQLSVRFSAQRPFVELSSRSLLPAQTTLAACERIEGALHVVMDIDAVPGQARDREMRLTEDGQAELMPRPERKMRFPEPPERLRRALQTLGDRGDLHGCEAVDTTGVTFFAWYRDENVATVSASTGTRWVDVAHFEGHPSFECQSGGRGLFVASERGLYLVEPEGSQSEALVGAAPALLEQEFVRLPRLRSRAGFSQLKAHPATVPSRLQLIGDFSHVRTKSFERLGQGGPFINFTNERLPSTSWSIIAAIQWDFGNAPLPYSSSSDDRNRLEAVTGQLTLTNAVAAPVAVYPGPLQRRASEEVWDALHRILQTEEY